MARKDISDAKVLQVYLDERNGAARIALLMERTEQPEKVCWRAMERACDRGYIEYGVSLGAGWLTNEGRALLGLPASTTWPQVIGVDVAAQKDQSAIGRWDPSLRHFVEIVSGCELAEWQARFLDAVTGDGVQRSALRSIALPKKQA